MTSHSPPGATWTKYSRIFALLADKRVIVKIEQGDLSKLNEPEIHMLAATTATNSGLPTMSSLCVVGLHPVHQQHVPQCLSQMKPSHSDSTYCPPPPSTPTSQQLILEMFLDIITVQEWTLGYVTSECMQSKMDMNRIRRKRRYSFIAVTDMPKPI